MFWLLPIRASSIAPIVSNIPTIDLLAILKKNVDRTIFNHIWWNFLMCTIPIEDQTTLNRSSCSKMYKNNARSRLFCRIAKRSIEIEVILKRKAIFTN